MFFRKLSPSELDSLLEYFHDLVVPLVLERGFSLHDLFIYSRKYDDAMYQVVSRLWHTVYGREYLRSWFRDVKPYLSKRGF